MTSVYDGVKREIEDLKAENAKLKNEIARIKTIFRVNMLRYVPNIRHEDIDEFLAGGGT